MANIWKANKDVNNHPNRNNFDLTFQNHLTMKMGTLYPVFCKRVVPGDSFRINTAFGLKFMPMVFPVQSRMRAHMHYFYVRNKNLWKQWENWISGLVTNDEHPHPYLSVDDSKVKTGSIHDFLGVPTTVVTHDAVDLPFSPVQLRGGVISRVSTASISNGSPIVPSEPAVGGVYDRFPLLSPSVFVNGRVGSSFLVRADFLKDMESAFSIPSGNINCFINFFEYVGDETDVSSILDDFSNIILFDSVHRNVSDWTKDVSFSFSESFSSSLNDAIDSGRKFLVYFSFLCTSLDQSSTVGGSAFLPLIPSAGFYEYSELGGTLYRNLEHLNALPYRAYESIYRAYYANSVLQPLRDADDKPVYNEYNTTTDDGADATDYHLFQRNYELDPYTSAMPSPQQGIAPLVGMTALGDVTIEDENGITTAKAEIDNDGTISKVVLTSPAASVEHARTAMNIAAAGLSINDFRAGNALQRLLETSLRKGYRYMDFIAGHFGKEPEYRELDMPEFIGGFSRDVNVSTTFASADTYNPETETGANLGDYVGNASLFGGSQHSVSHYCDDYGWIIGILCVTPTPAYSQILQKQMIAPSNYLDYMFPEMNSLGLQPITYEEMTPLQRYFECLVDSDKKMQDTFGYQRIYHDYVSSIDELHGEFRGSMKDYLVNRIFAESPELGDEFIKINPEEINDIFVNTTPTDDTIVGQIIFDVKAKRPINRIVIPGLGR